MFKCAVLSYWLHALLSEVYFMECSVLGIYSLFYQAPCVCCLHYRSFGRGRKLYWGRRFLFFRFFSGALEDFLEIEGVIGWLYFTFTTFMFRYCHLTALLIISEPIVEFLEAKFSWGDLMFVILDIEIVKMVAIFDCEGLGEIFLSCQDFGP